MYSNDTSITLTGTWSHSVENSIYETYSNASNAQLSFSFVGVGLEYVAGKKYDRGKFSLSIDGNATTVDLYQAGTSTTASTVQWSSESLEYASHKIVLSQISVDSRLGFYPYLISETWQIIIPTNITEYTATEVRSSTTGASSQTSSTSAASSTSTSSKKSSSAGAIAGGVVGGITALALALLAAWFFIRRRNRAENERIDNLPREKHMSTMSDDAARRSSYGTLGAQVHPEEPMYGYGETEPSSYATYQQSPAQESAGLTYPPTYGSNSRGRMDHGAAPSPGAFSGQGTTSLYAVDPRPTYASDVRTSGVPSSNTASMYSQQRDSFTATVPGGDGGVVANPDSNVVMPGKSSQSHAALWDDNQPFIAPSGRGTSDLSSFMSR
ncbi:hypothetical protein MNV49_000069 [Pseudohyphozyma bogoriensis]|nr:hypothetical protein MNV49_000069 [Pseudohyphozyma bogoriensis]